MTTAVKSLVFMLATFAFSSLVMAEEIIVNKVYSEKVATYSRDGNFDRDVESKLVFKAKVKNKGKTNDMGLLEIALTDGNTAWVQPSHISTNYQAKTCRSVKQPTASKDKKAPVNSGVAGECDD